jgi:hypothetical protein
MEEGSWNPWFLRLEEVRSWVERDQGRRCSKQEVQQINRALPESFQRTFFPPLFTLHPDHSPPPPRSGFSPQSLLLPTLPFSSENHPQYTPTLVHQATAGLGRHILSHWDRRGGSVRRIRSTGRQQSPSPTPLPIPTPVPVVGGFKKLFKLIFYFIYMGIWLRTTMWTQTQVF